MDYVGREDRWTSSNVKQVPHGQLDGVMMDRTTYYGQPQIIV